MVEVADSIAVIANVLTHSLHEGIICKYQVAFELSFCHFRLLKLDI